jgi:hypothetical protein
MLTPAGAHMHGEGGWEGASGGSNRAERRGREGQREGEIGEGGREGLGEMMEMGVGGGERGGLKDGCYSRSSSPARDKEQLQD